MPYLRVTTYFLVTMSIEKSKNIIPNCQAAILGIQDALDILGGKWTMMIIYFLIENNHEVNTFTKIEKSKIAYQRVC